MGGRCQYANKGWSSTLETNFCINLKYFCEVSDVSRSYLTLKCISCILQVRCITFIPYSEVHLLHIAGIGADDAFIFCKVWRCIKAEKDNGISVELVHDAVKHATPSMFVTSLTTASAFYASYISSITAIKCFRLDTQITLSCVCVCVCVFVCVCIVT
jgi:hypothetical protein